MLAFAFEETVKIISKQITDSIQAFHILVEWVRKTLIFTTAFLIGNMIGILFYIILFPIPKTIGLEVDLRFFVTALGLGFLTGAYPMYRQWMKPFAPVMLGCVTLLSIFIQIAYYSFCHTESSAFAWFIIFISSVVVTAWLHKMEMATK